MKMVIKVELFFVVEGENLTARDIKEELVKRSRERWEMGRPLFESKSESLSFVRLDGSRGNATARCVTEEEAYDQLR